MTIKAKIVFGLIAMVAFVFGVVAFAPARLLDAPARAALAPYGDLTNTVGTVWSGSGVLVLGTNISNASLGGRSNNPNALKVPITWQFTPASLGRLRLGFNLIAKSDAIVGVTHAGVGFRNIEISEADINVDASFISALNSLIAFAGPRGALRLKTNTGDHITLAYRGPLSVSGRLGVSADNLLLRTLSSWPVGSYDLDINFRDNLAEYNFVKSSGLLTLDGGGMVQWLPRKEFAYNGSAKASLEAPLLFAAILPLGRPTLDGRVQIDYKGSW